MTDKNIVPVNIGNQMEDAYCAYMQMVILNRALPDVRDGLKPVHRRILFAMHNEFPASGGYKKSARIVGETMGKYHPHGDSAIYEAMVKMAQPWNMTAPVVDGQGNFGSPDGDSPAAMRYTEARMSKIGALVTMDLDNLDPKRPTMIPNYDEEQLEPSVMPTRYPTALVNGSTGIAVGMACEAPPYNLKEVCLGAIARIKNPELTFQELFKIIQAPDFPTRCIIAGDMGIQDAMTTGRGRITMEGHAKIIEEKKKTYISVSSLPYRVEKTNWLENVNNLINDQQIVGISHIGDHSDKKGMDVRFTIKNDANPEIVLNALYKFTKLRTTFSVNSNYINRGAPQTLNVLEMLDEWINFRIETVYERTEYEVNKYRDAMKKQIALWVARYDIDRVIKTLRESEDRKEAINKIAQFEFITKDHVSLIELLKIVEPDKDVPEKYILGNDIATVIADQRLSVLTAAELDKVLTNIVNIRQNIERCEEILANDLLLRNIIVEELEEIVRKYGVDRMSEVVAGAGGTVADTDLITTKDVLLTLTEQGYIKLTDCDAFRDQRRGGLGKNGMTVRDNDAVSTSFFCSNKDILMFFTAKGMVYMLPAWRIDEGSLNSKGRFIANYLPTLDADDRVTNIVIKPNDYKNKSIIFVTSEGTVRRNPMSSFDNINSNGKIAMKLSDDIKIVSVFIAEDDKDDIFIYSSDGNAVRFHLHDDVLRPMETRNSIGVKGIRLTGNAKVLGGLAIPHFNFEPSERESYHDGSMSEERKKEFDNASVQIMTVTSDGFGKRFSSNEISVIGRGSKGVSIVRSVKSALLLCRVVSADDSISLTTDNGQTIRIPAISVKETKSRIARGVKLINLDNDAKIASCSVIARMEDDDENILSIIA